MTKKWCLEHGSFSAGAGTSAVRYLNDDGTPLRIEIRADNGKLFVTYKNKGNESFTREVREGETFYVEVRERTSQEDYETISKGVTPA